MVALTWDKVGDRTYEAGVDHGVLYIPDAGGAYTKGYAWNGLTAITESPSGADATPLYADNIKYLNLVAAEQFGASIEAYTYPEQFGQCDGTAAPQAGVSVGQQSRKSFGLSFRTELGNDVDGTDFGYKLHLVYGALAAPSDKAHTTVNDKPDAITFKWAVTTTPVTVPNLKPTSQITIDSTKVVPADLAALELLLYGTGGVEPALPSPGDVIALFGAGVLQAVPVAPTYVQATKTITIPTVAGVTYKIDGIVKAAGPVVITKDTVVFASPNTGYTFPEVSDNDWFFSFT